MVSIRITPGSPAPIYQQITTQVRHGIATGGLKAGELLPSVRALAEELLINPNTVARAYAELSRDGVIEPLAGRGMAVASRRAGGGLTRGERVRRIEPSLTQLVHDAIGLELSAEDVQELLNKKWKSLAPGVKTASESR